MSKPVEPADETVTSGAAQINVVVNWLHELERLVPTK
jgi:hypothetical protein